MTLTRTSKIFMLIAAMCGAIGFGCGKRVDQPARPATLAEGSTQIRVIDETTGRPLERFTVAISRESDQPFPDHFSLPSGFGPMPPGDLLEIVEVTSRDGIWTVPGLPDGATHLTVGSSSHRPRVLTLLPHPGLLTVVLSRVEHQPAPPHHVPSPTDTRSEDHRAMVTFRVDDVGLPRSLRCHLNAIRDDSRTRSSRIQADGAARTRLEPGLWTARAVCSGADTHITTGSETVEVRDEDQSVELSFLNPSPVAVLLNGIRARYLLLEPVDESITTRTSLRLATDPPTVRGLRSGRYRLVVEGRYVTEVEIPSEIQLDIHSHELTIEYDAGDEPPDWMRLTFAQANPTGAFAPVREPHIYNVKRGLWTSTGLLEGTYEIDASAPGFHPQRTEIQLTESSTLNVRLDPIPLPSAAPFEQLPELEAAILRQVLHDVRRRIDEAWEGEAGPVHILAQTDQMSPHLTGGDWSVEREPFDMDTLLERFELRDHRPDIEISPIAVEAGLIPERLDQLPAVQSRLGTSSTTLGLINEWALEQERVLLATTRPRFDRDRREAIVLVTSYAHDPFHWLYLIDLRSGVPIIRLVADPVLGC